MDPMFLTILFQLFVVAAEARPVKINVARERVTTHAACSRSRSAISTRSGAPHRFEIAHPSSGFFLHPISTHARICPMPLP